MTLKKVEEDVEIEGMVVEVELKKKVEVDVEIEE